MKNREEFPFIWIPCFAGLGPGPASISLARALSWFGDYFLASTEEAASFLMQRVNRFPFCDLIRPVKWFPFIAVDTATL